MFICNRCGKCVDILPTTTSTSEFWGSPAVEYLPDGDCICGGDFIEAERCDCCREWFLPEELNEDGLCQFCAEDEDNDQENVE